VNLPNPYPPLPASISCAICRTGTMTNWRESATVVIYRCESCGSLHGRGKSEIIPRTWSDDHA